MKVEKIRTAPCQPAKSSVQIGGSLLWIKNASASICDLTSQTLTVGKTAACSIRLVDRMVSRLHCALYATDNSFIIEDLNSLNGTCIDGLEIRGRRQHIFYDTRIRLGNQRLTLLKRISHKNLIYYVYHGITTRSTEMLKLFDDIGMVADRSTPILITGESGCGKELVAQAIHAASPRKNKPFVAINCASIPRDLVATTLFGHERGSFTGAHSSRPGLFEEANEGVLFLDEIGELLPEHQAALLRVLETGEVTRVGSANARKVNVRILAATNRNLIQQVHKEVFRLDLLYRISVFKLNIPPLRERPEDIAALFHNFCLNHTEAGVPFVLSDTALHRLAQHAWPGNVREVRNMVEFLSAKYPAGSHLGYPELAPLLPQQKQKQQGVYGIHLNRYEVCDSGSAAPAPGKAWDRILIETLRKNDGNRAQTYRQLGISRSSLFTRLKRLREQGFHVPPPGHLRPATAG